MQQDVQFVCQNLSDPFVAVQNYDRLHPQLLPLHWTIETPDQPTQTLIRLSSAPASHPTVTTLLNATPRWKLFAMNRIFKLSVLPLPTAAGVAVHFSSYPGVINSMDDFYSVLDTQLTVTETTNEINNPKIYALCEPKSVGSWARQWVAPPGDHRRRAPAAALRTALSPWPPDSAGRSSRRRDRMQRRPISRKRRTVFLNCLGCMKKGTRAQLQRLAGTGNKCKKKNCWSRSSAARRDIDRRTRCIPSGQQHRCE